MALGRAAAAKAAQTPAGNQRSEIRYSFDDEKPWVVAFNMYWDPEIK